MTKHIDDYNGINSGTRYALYNARLDKFMATDFKSGEDILEWSVRWIDEEDPPNETDSEGFSITPPHALIWRLLDDEVDASKRLVNKIIEKYQPLGLDLEDPLVLVEVSTIRGTEREYYDWKYYFHFENSFSLNELIKEM